MAKRTKIVFKIGSVLNVIYLGKTTNKKLTRGKSYNIVQTAHFSKEQYEYVLNGGKDSRKFFNLDKSNCLDCPFSSSKGGGCYTDGFDEYRGFLSQLRSIVSVYGSWANIPNLSTEDIEDILRISENRFIRFGKYGEPTFLPIALIDAMTKKAMRWTGYTHQWRRRPEFSPYFMASVESLEDERIANLIGYRSFLVARAVKVGKSKLYPLYEATARKTFIPCPASKELDLSSCYDCGLCSGTKGTKASKSIVIQEH